MTETPLETKRPTAQSGDKAGAGQKAMTVLVVDDSPTSRMSVTRVLRDEGYRMMIAGDGEEALAMVRAERPDVVITDILMPLMDGYEFARRLRADPLVAQTPIIFHTAGYELEEAQSLADSCGISYVLSKPARREELRQAIDAVLTDTRAPLAPPEESFYRAHRRLLTDKLSEKVIQLEAALAESQKKEVRLQQTIEDTIKTERALERSNKDLLHKNEEIQNFYHTVSHELKTPLTSAREFVSIVMDGLAGPLNDTQREYLGIARESCNRLRLCINDLMDATRLETGKMTLELKPASIAKVIQQLVTVLGPVAKRKDITLTTEIEDLPDFPFDENRMMQVLVNLANNALKFTPTGGRVTITADLARDYPDHVKVCVQDSGCGLGESDLERIFERLYQVPNEDGGSSPGVGLGLYISRELVECHGGKIWAESKLGEGSTFCFVLPKHQPSELIEVLVVDDEERTRGLMRRALEREGFQVTTAENGAAALELVKQRLPDVVITDLMMPKMDGAEMLKQIRQNWSLLPVVILTGYPNNEQIKRAMEFSPFTLMAKPCPIAQLIQLIRRMSGAKGLHK
jgi:two-component system sensor histidine kinase/response regulator